ncbi:flagellar basal body-associated protein FliL [Methanococcus voltae]|uniref:hypothetical protein n=1 Tax=Methanococcus voltae TaxID=2188 RepID=UPI001AE6E591|nr:hypothetical protein [Methanococcus voltae]MBP2143910.1 flagellar basal body-associated protein FliL [Methanococcus voltae]
MIEIILMILLVIALFIACICGFGFFFTLMAIPKDAKSIVWANFKYNVLNKKYTFLARDVNTGKIHVGEHDGNISKIKIGKRVVEQPRIRLKDKLWDIPFGEFRQGMGIPIRGDAPVILKKITQTYGAHAIGEYFNTYLEYQSLIEDYSEDPKVEKQITKLEDRLSEMRDKFAVVAGSGVSYFDERDLEIYEDIENDLKEYEKHNDSENYSNLKRKYLEFITCMVDKYKDKNLGESLFILKKHKKTGNKIHNTKFIEFVNLADFDDYILDGDPMRVQGFIEERTANHILKHLKDFNKTQFYIIALIAGGVFLLLGGYGLSMLFGQQDVHVVVQAVNETARTVASNATTIPIS